GLAISLGRGGFHSAEDELPVMDFVRDTKSSGDLYFVPVRVPGGAGGTPAPLSSGFIPPRQKRPGNRVIPVDPPPLRPHHGAPLFVDFKSIPYRDVDVIEWRDRLRQAQQVQELLGKGEVPEALKILRERGVTHLVLPAGLPASDPALRPIYKDAAYRVYR